MKSMKERFGRVELIGVSRSLVNDLYHRIVTMSWARFFLLFGLFFLFFNGLFGFLYWVNPGSVSGPTGNYFEYFAFSVQTFSTIGYGAFLPSGTYGHALVVIEALLSFLLTAVLAGLTFAKFSRPMAKVLFSENILIHQFDGKRTLTLRIGNLRGNQIISASIKVVALINFKTKEGLQIRKQHELKLMRDTTSFFMLTWQVFHFIDESSPIYQLSREDLIQRKIDFSVSFVGFDESIAQTIHSSCIYSADEVLEGVVFEDVIQMSEGRVQAVTYNLFNKTKAVSN